MLPCVGGKMLSEVLGEMTKSMHCGKRGGCFINGSCLNSIPFPQILSIFFPPLLYIYIYIFDN